MNPFHLLPLCLPCLANCLWIARPATYSGTLKALPCGSSELVEHWKVSLPPAEAFGWSQIGGKLKISSAEEKQKTWCWHMWQPSGSQSLHSHPPTHHILQGFQDFKKIIGSRYKGHIKSFLLFIFKITFLHVDESRRGFLNWCCKTPPAEQNAIYKLKMPENQFLLAWLTWGKPWNYFKQIGTNWVISLQFFLLHFRLPWIVFFLANCQFILPWLKILKLNVMLKEATAGNDWIVKWEQCVEAPKKEIGSCLRNEAKESHVNSVIENCLY